MGVRLKGVEPGKRGLVVQLLVKLLLPNLRQMKCVNISKRQEGKAHQMDVWISIWTERNKSFRKTEDRLDCQREKNFRSTTNFMERLMHCSPVDNTAYQRSGWSRISCRSLLSGWPPLLLSPPNPILPAARKHYNLGSFLWLFYYIWGVTDCLCGVMIHHWWNRISCIYCWNLIFWSVYLTWPER